MSWKDRIEDVRFTIKTGDGKKFTPLWKNGAKSKAYNFSKYDFIDVEKSLIDRKKPQSSKYPLTFWFQGDDNIEQSEAFEKSADDPRLWEIKHPFYGNIIGQPINITRDDTNFNITQITVEFWESITGNYPTPKASFEDVIVARTASLVSVSASAYAENVEPTTKDIQILGDNVVQVSSSFDKLFDDDTFSDYKTLVNKALSDVNNVISKPINAINSAHSLLLLPSLYEKSVKSRISALKESFNKVLDTLTENDTKNTKTYFESEAAVNIGAICQCTTNPLDTDYITKSDIESINTDIIDTYNLYLDTLDNSQVELSDVDNSFHANALVQSQLYDLVTETTGNLFSLAFSAKQERTVEVDRNTNIILLTHKYLGLDVKDENIEQFRQLNDIKNDELLLIKKGRTIKFFV